VVDRRYIVDRIEDGAWAVLESSDAGPPLQLPAAWLPAGAGEGVVIVVEPEGDGVVRFRLDAEATERRLEELTARRARLRRGPTGDFAL